MPTFIPISFFKREFTDKIITEIYLNKFQPIMICNQCLKKQFEGRKILEGNADIPPNFVLQNFY